MEDLADFRGDVPAVMNVRVNVIFYKSLVMNPEGGKVERLIVFGMYRYI